MKNLLILFLSLFIPLSIEAQTRSISGTVADEKTNELLVGASVVVVDDPTKGAITDVNGKYELKVADKKDVTLRFSFVGYESTTIAAGNSSVLDIKLTESKSLDEVVVIGYESVNKRDVLGSVSSVSSKQLRDVPLTNAAEALAGRLAGVQVTNTEGAPGADIVIRVRGGGSITQDNAPIYIVDGIQIENALNVISPQDIASIDVLKDASTTAIYGARGANGVVIITTKSGKKGRTNISYNGSYGWREISKTMDVLDPYEFTVWQYERGLLRGDTSWKQTYGSTFDTLSVYKNATPVSWQDKIFGGKSPYQNHNLSISGGSDKTTYSISLTRNDEAGIQISSGFSRNLVNIKFDHQANDRLKFGLSARYLNQTIDGIGTTASGSRTTNRLRHSITYRPLYLPRDGGEDDFFDEALYLSSAGQTNPIVMTEAEYRRRFQSNLNLAGNFSYQLVKGLTFRTTFGYDNNASLAHQFFKKISGTARNYGSLPVAIIDNGSAETFNNSNTLTYSTKFNKTHSLNLLVGHEFYQTQARGSKFETRYFPADITSDKALANMALGSAPSGTAQPLPSTSIDPYSRILSFFGRASYDWKSRFLASFSVRADRTTKFKYDNGLLLFPSGSVAWRFSKEKFLANNKFLTDGKLRVGFGTAGNNRIGDLLFQQLYGVNGAVSALNHAVVPGFVPAALSNEALKWEKTQSQNIGLDLGFLDNRIQVTIDAYRNRGNDLLLAVAIPPTSGYSSQLRNVGSTENKGVEIQLSGDIVKTKSFTWNSSFNISFNRNKVLSLGGLTQQTRNSGWQGSDGADDYLVKVGESVGLMYGFVTDGWYKVEDFDYNATSGAWTLKTGIPSSVNISGLMRPGALKIKDLNGDGQITTDGDRQVIGNANPNFIGGWNNQFMFKGFDMSVFVNFVSGNQVYNANKIEWLDGTFVNTNLLAVMKDRWRNIDASGKLITDPAALAAANTNAQIWSPANAQRYFLKSSDIEDGSFLRVNNITLGYTLPVLVSNRIRMQSLRVFGTVNNLHVFTKYTGFDPEVTARRTDPLTPGVDFGAYPRSRTFVFGVNATF